MLDRVAVAQRELANAVAELHRLGSADATRGEASLASLGALQRELLSASPADLAKLSDLVAATTAYAAAMTQDAVRAADAIAGQSPADRLAKASDAARQAVNSVMAGMKDFDPYLRFASAEDEREYREREEQRQKQIAAAQAKHTPDGDRAALALAEAQLRDAGNHGADRSPAWQEKMRSLENVGVELDAAQADHPKKVVAKAATPDHADEVSSAMAALAAAGVKGPPKESAVDGHGLQVATAADRGTLRG